MNWTTWPADDDAGLKVKDAVRAEPTMTVWLTLLEPEALVTVKVTEYDPARAKIWLGFWVVLVPESPKFHRQEAGLPFDVSVNRIVCPATGEAGL